MYIIGDIHSNIKELKSLFDLGLFEKGSTLIFLGDYINKNSSTKETVEFLCEVKRKNKAIFLRGNHEYVWERYLNQRELFREKFLLEFGGVEALAQFSGNPKELIIKHKIDVIRGYLKTYLDLIKDCQDYYLLDEYLVMHSGIEPSQIKEYPLKISEINFFIRPDKMEKSELYLSKYIIIAGHTFLGEEPYISENYINIDLGAGYNKYLGAFDVMNQRVIRSDGTIFNVKK